MTLWWSAALIAAGATVGVGLAGSALGAWREERSGRVYELTPRYLRVAGRAALAAVALVGAAVGGAMAATGDGRPVAAVAPAPHASAAHPGSDRAGSDRAGSGGAGSGRAGSGHGGSDPTASGQGTHNASAALALVGQPAGGRLYLGTLPGGAGQVRVWVPSQYAARSVGPAGSGSGLLQALVVRAPEGELAAVWDGLAGAVTGGHANPFVVVAPVDPCAQATDDGALRGAVAGQFRVASRGRSWAELGIDAGSSCAVAAELAHPNTYAGAAALGGALPRPAAAPAPGVRLLLAQAHRDTSGQGEAGRLRSALQGAPDASVRLSAVVRDTSTGRERFRLVRMAANYLTEEFAAASRR